MAVTRKSDLARCRHGSNVYNILLRYVNIVCHWKENTQWMALLFAHFHGGQWHIKGISDIADKADHLISMIMKNIYSYLHITLIEIKVAVGVIRSVRGHTDSAPHLFYTVIVNQYTYNIQRILNRHMIRHSWTLIMTCPDRSLGDLTTSTGTMWCFGRMVRDNENASPICKTRI